MATLIPIPEAGSTHWFPHSTITFASEAPDNKLTITINTKRLHMQSFELQDLEKAVSLFGNPAAMKQYGTGEPQTRDQVTERINNIWEKRRYAQDPYHGFSVSLRGTNRFIGIIILGHGDHPGCAELAGIGEPTFSQYGYGTEAATAMIQDFAPATLSEGFLLEGCPLDTITATARIDNIASCCILEHVGMQNVGQGEKYGALRNFYQIKVNKPEKL